MKNQKVITAAAKLNKVIYLIEKRVAFIPKDSVLVELYSIRDNLQLHITEDSPYKEKHIGDN